MTTAEAERPANARELILLALLALVLLAPGFWAFPPIDRDEPRYATATTQMLATHDFVDIHYQDQPRYLQPAGIYWLQTIPTALFSAPGHRAIWTFRLPSLLAAVLAVVFTGFSASRVWGRKVGLGAAVLLAGCMSLGFEARIGKTDAALLAAVSVAQFTLMRAYVAGALSRRAAAAFWIAVGCGVLLKGPIVFLVTGLTTVALVLWDRRAGWLKALQPLWGVPLMLLVALPWYVAIGEASHGLFYKIAIGKSMMGKVAAGQQAHGAPFGYHFAAFPLTFWPASILIVMAAPFAWRERRDPAVRFLLAWAIPSWIVFEVVKTKLPHYTLPLFPALACLAALALFRPGPAVKPWLRALFFAFAAIWLVASGLLSVLSPVALHLYEHRTDAIAIGLAGLSLAAVAALLVFLAHRQPVAVLAAATAASAFTAWNVYAAGLPRMQSLWVSQRVEALVQSVKPCPGSRLISSPFHEPSLVFLNGPERTILAETAGEAADRLSADRACGLALLDAQTLPAFTARAAAVHLPLIAKGQVLGRDYADGRNLVLTLYAAGR